MLPMFIVIASVMFVLGVIFTISELPKNKEKIIVNPSGAGTISSSVKVRAAQFSFIGWQVVKAFEALPEASRPGYDIVTAIKALDFKYGREAVDQHFPYDQVKNINGRIRCACTDGPHYRGGYSSSFDRYEKRPKECQKFLPYVTLIEEMKGIEKDIQAQAKALERQEHALKLAGMQSDIDSIDSIMAALKQEREAISSTTSEIYRQTERIK